MTEEKDKHNCCGHDHDDHDHEHHHHHDGCGCHHHHDDEHKHVHRGGCPCCHHDEEEEEELTKGRLIFLICRLAFGLILAFLGLFLWNEQNLREMGLSDIAALWVNFAIMAVAYLAVGYDILWKTIKHFRHIKDLFDENTLMTIATIGAFCLRFFGEQQNEFFEAVMVVFLYQVGELFEDISVDRSKKAIEDAVGLRAKKACLLHEGKKEEVDPETLKIGDQILISVGDIIPADGVIVSGNGGVNMASLTGESLPVEMNVGDNVNSGTTLVSGSLVVEVTKEYEDSTVSKIIRLVKEGESSKSKAQRFVTTFAKIYTPIVCLIALLVAVIPPLFIGIGDSAVWASWLYSAICLLVISCPCAIVVSVPLAYFAAIGLASKNGILVKGASYLDWLSSLDAVASDKTGTITLGVFSIDHFKQNEIDEELFKEYLFAAESRSNHPLARAIMGDDDGSKYQEHISEYNEIAGRGVSMVYKGHSILAGSSHLLEENGISFTRCDKKGSTTYLAMDGKYVGHATLKDKIKETSKEMVDALSSMNIDTIILTGDRKDVSEEIGAYVGAKKVHSELLPEDKKRILEGEIKVRKGGVAYIGDGINDAPSLAVADVGIAMGGAGSDIAVDSADVVIMNDDPRKVVKAVKIAKAGKAKALFNIIASLVVKVAIAALSIVFGEAFPLWAAVLADTGLTLILVLNSVSLLFKKVK
ncbi:MAG: cadmium-translocating P-type ATPase [Bacilli bacterium]|nr:cadmium-translocating P-type ATPase [Bacilli bacterium]